jgi:hypothetical protein
LVGVRFTERPLHQPGISSERIDVQKVWMDLGEFGLQISGDLPSLLKPLLDDFAWFVD